MLTHLSLFSGIGGIDLAAEWAGFQTVAFCEKNKFCQQILKKHWSNVPIIEDIHDVPTSEFLGQYRTGRLTLISGGFPCQPFSTAGKRRGKEDDRYLWPAMLEVIKTYRPTWVLGENVAGIVSLALDTVISDLETAGYPVQPFIIPACSVGALHKRERVFIVGHTSELVVRTVHNFPGNVGEAPTETSGTRKSEIFRPSARSSRTDVAHPENIGLDRAGETWAGRDGFENSGEDVPNATSKQTRFARVERQIRNQWTVEPNVGRVAHGVSRRVDRLRALGNAVVPQQVYPILKAIADIEHNFG